MDAGCGVGGTAIYIAEKTGVQVTGISIVPREIKLAKKYAKDRGVSNLTKFDTQDYSKTDFKDSSFDIIYGVESICHCSPKTKFLKEAYRLLKPGGKLVIADGYVSWRPRVKREDKIIEEFKKAFALKEFITPQEMTKAIMHADFIKIKEIDKLDAVKPSISYFYKLATYTKPLTSVLSLIPVSYLQAGKRNNTALLCEGIGMKSGLVAYYIHYAEKPNT